MAASMVDSNNRLSSTSFFSMPNLKTISDRQAKLHRGNTAPEISSPSNRQHTDSSTLRDSTIPTKSIGATTTATSSGNHHSQTIAKRPNAQATSTKPASKPPLEINQEYRRAYQAIFEAQTALFELTKQRKLMAEERAASKEVMAEFNRRERLERKMNGWWRRMEEERSESVDNEEREKRGAEESGVGNKYDAGSWCEDNVGLNYEDSSSDEDGDLFFENNGSGS